MWNLCDSVNMYVKEYMLHKSIFVESVLELLWGLVAGRASNVGELGFIWECSCDI